MLRQKICSLLVCIAVLCASHAVASTVRPTVVSLQELTGAEREALHGMLTAVLLRVLGGEHTKLATATVRYHYVVDNERSALCEERSLDEKLPAVIYRHTFGGIERLFGEELEKEVRTSFFAGVALPDTPVFVSLAASPKISFHPIPGGTLVTIAPFQLVVMRERLEA